MTTEKYIDRVRMKHDNKYDYSFVTDVHGDIKYRKTKIKVICKEHGIFEQTPEKHYDGRGCPRCGYKLNAANQSKGLNTFIQEAKKIHNNRYDYSLVKYKNASSKVEITCLIHGIFKQTPDKHIHVGQGCPKCSKTRIKSLDEIVKLAAEIHGVKYNYSSVKYINMRIKVDIICPNHGIFQQSLNKHISSKQGCPRCNDSSGEKIISKMLSDNNILYKHQHFFINCRNINQLPFDFYLPEFNLCIEYDGIQHFKPIKLFGGDEALKYVQNNDSIKTKYCIDNGISILRIKFDDKDVENILKTTLDTINREV